MKNGDVLTYCREVLDGLDRSEHVDTFNFENIPKPRLSSAYHLELGQTTGQSNNQDHQIARVPVTVRLPYAPARSVKPIRDAAVEFADTVIAAFLDPRNRLTQTNSVKNVAFTTMALEPLDDSNDNGLKVIIVFTMLVVTSTR